LADIICSGVEFEVQEIINFCNSRVQVPIFALRGNHDMRHYKDFLGLLSYSIVLDNFVCIFLDNPLGYFLDQDIDFLERELNSNKNRSVLIFMHVPPPTDIYSAHLPESEWGKIRTILDKHKERINHIFSAHIHGYHDYSIDGFPVTITAGGGAAMIHNLIKQEQKFFHAVILNLRQDGSLIKEVIPV
jgi:DNA repair exonuclease SbcCD nuclease subunit